MSTWERLRAHERSHYSFGPAMVSIAGADPSGGRGFSIGLCVFWCGKGVDFLLRGANRKSVLDCVESRIIGLHLFSAFL